MGGSPSWFVRASEGAPEKGPFTPAQLAKSHERNLLGKDAKARLEGSEEWRPLADVAKEILAERAEKKSKRARRSVEDETHALGGAPSRRSLHPFVWLGVVVGLGGLAVTVGFAATGREGGVWPVGLVLAGLYMIVRGLITGARRDE